MWVRRLLFVPNDVHNGDQDLSKPASCAARRSGPCRSPGYNMLPMAAADMPTTRKSRHHSWPDTAHDLPHHMHQARPKPSQRPIPPGRSRSGWGRAYATYGSGYSIPCPSHRIISLRHIKLQQIKTASRHSDEAWNPHGCGHVSCRTPSAQLKPCISWLRRTRCHCIVLASYS